MEAALQRDKSKMWCTALLAAVAFTYLICVLVLSGMQKEDLDVNLLKKLHHHNINVDDINSNAVRQECMGKSSKLSILETRRNNDNTSNYQNINTTTTTTTNVDNSSKIDINNTTTVKIFNTTTVATLTKDVLKDGSNETKDNDPYEVRATKNHNIKTRSSVNDVTSTQPVKNFSEAMTFFGEQKNLENVLKMLQTFIVAKLADNNNTKILKAFTTSQITTIPSTKSIEITTESKNKDSDLVKVLATFVFNKPIPVEPRYTLDDKKNSVVSKQLDNRETKYVKTDRPDECSNNKPELFPDQDYLFYKSKTAEITSLEDKPSIQSNFEQMMNGFLTKNKRKPKNTLDYGNKDSSFTTSHIDSIYAQNYGTTPKNYRQKKSDDFEYFKVDDIIKPEKSDKNEAAKTLHPDVIKEIADTVKDLVLKDLKKDVNSIVTPEYITTTIPQKLENQNNIQPAKNVIQKFVELMEQFKSAKEFIVSPAKYDSSKEVGKNTEFRIEAKEENKNNFKSHIKPLTINDYNKMNAYVPNVATANEYKRPMYNVPMQYPQQYPSVSYLDNIPNMMVPPLMSNPYGVQQPGGRAIINVPQRTPHNNKPNTINIITPVNRTPVININHMRPAPITVQTSKEIPPLGIPVSIPSALNRNIVMPMQQAFMTALNKTERQRWAYRLKYGRNPDTKFEITDRKDKLSQYTNFRNEPNENIKEPDSKKTDSSILNFPSNDKQEKLTDYTKLTLPTLNVRDRDETSDLTVFAPLLPNSRDRNRMNDRKISTLLAVNKQERDRLIDFKNNNLPNFNINEPDRLSGSMTFNSLDKQERDRMIDPLLTTKDMTMNKLNTNYKQQQAYDEEVLSDIKSKVVYKDMYKTDEEYRGLTIHQPGGGPRIPDIPKYDYYDQSNVFNSRLLEAGANDPHIDPNTNRDYNDFAKREPYREYNIVKQRDPMYIVRKDPIPKQIHDIKGFHEKLERGDFYERRDPVNAWYENPDIPRQYDVNANKYDEADYSKTRIESRQQLPLTGRIKMTKFDDTHFKNFLKTQQKVNDMLERILATKTDSGHRSDFPPSVENT